jgi:N-acetylglutamate synthase-like GNAT family acetyltransferase
MGNDFNYKHKIPRISVFKKLFDSTGWNTVYHATETELKKSLRNSWFCISVYSKEKLIGFGRMLSDGCLYSILCDMIVLPEYRNMGIGTNILKRLIAKCKQENIKAIWLFAAKDKKDFYSKRGFEIRPDDRPGMYYKF